LHIIVYTFELELLISALFATFDLSQLYSKFWIFILDNKYKITKSIKIKKANFIQYCVVSKNRFAQLLDWLSIQYSISTLELNQIVKKSNKIESFKETSLLL
jgi:hypothetical protein